jgi:ubiquitin C-terminal hydrolase
MGAVKSAVGGWWNKGGRGGDAAMPPCSLADCFRAFSVQETLDENDAWYCSKCKEHVCATKKMDLWRCPDVLVIHLKRFQYTRLWREKLDTYVN